MKTVQVSDHLAKLLSQKQGSRPRDARIQRDGPSGHGRIEAGMFGERGPSGTGMRGSPPGVAVPPQAMGTLSPTSCSRISPHPATLGYVNGLSSSPRKSSSVVNNH